MLSKKDAMAIRFGYYGGYEDAELAKMEGVEPARERRRRLKKRYMSPELDFEDMFKQSCARVNFMKTRRNTMHAAGTPQWLSYTTVEKYLSQFKYHRAENIEAEKFLAAAIGTGRKDDEAKYREDANNHLSKCLFAHYVIGKLYTEFIADSGTVV